MKSFRRIFLAILISLAVLAAVSCVKVPALKKDRFDIAVGEFLDIAQYVDGEFVLDVQDSSAVMTVCDTVLKGLEPGTVSATVVRGAQTDTVTVNVNYANPVLNISCNSSLYTTVIGSLLNFTADLGANADQTAEIIWEVNGGTAGVGKTFQLLTNSYAKYVVTASVAGQEDSLTAVCYAPFASTPIIAAQKTAAELGESVNFAASIDSQTPAHTAWYVDGAVAKEGESEFNFTANEIGKHVVYAKVNGVKTNEITVTVSGKATLTNVRCDFDSSYPDVYLRWDGAKDVSYEVQVAGTTYTGDDRRFDGNQFDLSGLVDLNNSTSVSLKCLGNDYIAPSDVIAVNTPTVTEQEKTYLSKKYFDGNYYMTSDREVYDIIAYAMIFRPQITKIGLADKVTLNLYCGYDSNQTAALLLSKGWAQTEQTGSYSIKASGKASKGNVITMEITFYTVGAPDEIDVSYKTSYPSLTTPTFGNGFLYENIENGYEVSTSDELYYVVQKGYEPQPTVGSSADRIFTKAKQTLNAIVSEQMDDEQKVRAIFEWVMWQTNYDYEVAAETNVAKAVKEPAFYLEGVFDYGFAVCDGIAKSVSLLCNMVDVPCVRVVGIANDGVPTRHAWNKVKIGEKWYLLDATWSDSKVNFDGTYYEGGLHAYYLKADCEMPTHKATYPELYPESDDIYDWYGRGAEYSGGFADMFVEDASLNELKSSIERGAQGASFEVTIGDQVTERDFYCIEIRLSHKAKSYFKANSTFINTAILAAIDLEIVPWTIVSDYLLIMLHK